VDEVNFMPACNDDAMDSPGGDGFPDNFKEVSETEKTPDTVMDQSPETPSQKRPGTKSPDVIEVPSPYDPARYPDNQLGLLSPSPATWAICFLFSYNKE
jgi:hypothetical protein